MDQEPTNPVADSILARTFWNAVGYIALVLGGIGVLLPVMPTTPFILLAAFAFAKSSPKMRSWLLSLKFFGPIIIDWERNGAVAPRYKFLACVLMLVAFIGALILQLPLWALVFQGVCTAGVAVYLITRPSGPAG